MHSKVSPAHSKISDARQQIETLRQALLSASPEEIEGSLPWLAETAGSLRELQTATPDAALAAELKLLKNELKIAARTIAHGAAFYRGWANLLGAAAAMGYTPTGDAAALRVPGRVSVQG